MTAITIFTQESRDVGGKRDTTFRRFDQFFQTPPLLSPHILSLPNAFSFRPLPLLGPNTQQTLATSEAAAGPRGATVIPARRGHQRESNQGKKFNRNFMSAALPDKKSSTFSTVQRHIENTFPSDATVFFCHTVQRLNHTRVTQVALHRSNSKAIPCKKKTDKTLATQTITEQSHIEISINII